MKLYSGPLSMFGAKAEIALHEKGIDFDLVMVPFEMKTLYQPKHPDVARINPKQQVPVLIDGDLEIFNSTQIFEYLETIKPTPALWPSEPGAKARARLLEHVMDEIYFPPIVQLMRLAQTPDNSAAVTARAAAGAVYDDVERTLGARTWLAGDDFSYADITLYMAQLFGERWGVPMTGVHPRLRAWRDRMSARPPVAKVAGAMSRYLLSQGRPLPPFLQLMV